ncbi:RNA polymerase sigma factor [Streptomyces sp. WAC06614]|uniref:RNA polymerase sigma factor n=1 Tax=Streptomyces sp. WAC06614 TaxID=2487416 RepID=UPI000F78BD79|nr:sigma-70 family RNA polymerase sigma factor [Streptomyces sp. WAC06614]RSS80675.1 sigma-70 family RNA polymerase sigma factor [Streptomyces sp. WAC06614]
MTAPLAHRESPCRSAAGAAARRNESVPDPVIASLLAEGDERWLPLAHERWSRLVHTYAVRALGDAREAEDVTQQVFLAAWRGRSGFRPDRGALPAWLLGITRRKTADALSARTRRRELVAAATRDVFDGTVAGSEQVVDRVVVTEELARLPRLQREVLALAYFGDLTQVEIADRTGMPLGTVKSHARRGMQRLRLRVASADAQDRSGPPVRAAHSTE